MIEKERIQSVLIVTDKGIVKNGLVKPVVEALEATKLIFENVEKAYANGHDHEARANMLHAAYKAGIAFSKSYVGYIHAIAPSLGGKYGTPHGLAHAIPTL